MSERFAWDGWAAATLARGLIGLAVVGLCLVDFPPEWPAALSTQIGAGVLVIAVWYDAMLGWLARRRGWIKSATVTQLEGFVDCICFAWAPAQLAWKLSGDPRLLPLLALFVLGCVYRLARFNLEGLQHGGYRGLPVTYNGYWFPLVALAGWIWPDLLPLYTFGGLVLAVTPLMVSGRFTTSEV